MRAQRFRPPKSSSSSCGEFRNRLPASHFAGTGAAVLLREFPDSPQSNLKSLIAESHWCRFKASLSAIPWAENKRQIGACDVSAIVPAV